MNIFNYFLAGIMSTVNFFTEIVISPEKAPGRLENEKKRRKTTGNRCSPQFNTCKPVP